MQNEGYDLKHIGHEHDVLKERVDVLSRIVYFDEYTTVYTNTGQGNMGIPVFLDLSAYVPADAIIIFAQLYLRPSSNAYWQGRLYSSDTANHTLHVYSDTINKFNANMGTAKLTNTIPRGIYYRFDRISGAGQSSVLIRIYGYTIPA